MCKYEFRQFIIVRNYTEIGIYKYESNFIFLSNFRNIPVFLHFLLFHWFLFFFFAKNCHSSGIGYLSIARRSITSLYGQPAIFYPRHFCVIFHPFICSHLSRCDCYKFSDPLYKIRQFIPAGIGIRMPSARLFIARHSLAISLAWLPIVWSCPADVLLSDTLMIPPSVVPYDSACSGFSDRGTIPFGALNSFLFGAIRSLALIWAGALLSIFIAAHFSFFLRSFPLLLPSKFTRKSMWPILWRPSSSSSAINARAARTCARIDSSQWPGWPTIHSQWHWNSLLQIQIGIVPIIHPPKNRKSQFQAPQGRRWAGGGGEGGANRF